MIRDPREPIDDNSNSSEHDDHHSIVPRIFLREPGWSVALKPSSDREFCHQMHPGENSYHRLSQGEIYVQSPDERLCLLCASRRGLLHFEPTRLRKPSPTVQLDGPGQPGDTFKVVERPADQDLHDGD